MDLREAARAFAIKAHGGQTYNSPGLGERPYSVHLDHVAEVLERFGYATPVLVASAYLHDVLEDTETSQEELRQRFGDEITDIVFRVTNPRDGTRAEKHARTYPRTRENADSVLLKLADRIANSEAAAESNPRLLGMYLKEQAKFEDYLYREGEFEDLWAHLRRVLGVA